MKYCTNCKSVLNDNMRFCPSCGKEQLVDEASKRNSNRTKMMDDTTTHRKKQISKRKIQIMLEDEVVFEFSVMVSIILMVFLYWLIIPLILILMIFGSFAGYEYRIAKQTTRISNSGELMKDTEKITFSKRLHFNKSQAGIIMVISVGLFFATYYFYNTNEQQLYESIMVSYEKGNYQEAQQEINIYLGFTE